MKKSCLSHINSTDYSEKVDYDFKEYPIYIRLGILSLYPNYSGLSHWHEDVEFIYVRSGSMSYNINGKIVELEAGNGIMVNSRQFHYGYSKELKECEFICIIIHPLVLCINTYFERTYVNPIINNSEYPYLLLSKNIPWQKQVLTLLCKLYDQKQNAVTPLEIQASVLALWSPIYHNFPVHNNKAVRVNRQLISIKQMVTFIQDHYKEPISLSEIATAGNICKSSCSALFRKYLSQTPISYLTEYRLNKSVELLCSLDISITDIAYETGFNSPSYYSETFRHYYQCTPREYKNQIFADGRNISIPVAP